MGKKIYIILEAGASYDLIPVGQRTQAQAVRDTNFSPPRTSDLVKLPQVLEPYLAQYSRAFNTIGTG